MNLLDENFPEDQGPLLRQWHIPRRQIGRDLAHFGIQDSDIVPLLHRLRRVPLFAQDQDFFNRRLCHPAYCLVLLDVRADDAAMAVRRFLRHPRFKVAAKRMGVVARVHRDGIQIWHHEQSSLANLPWERD